jgi:ABC-2 type transport system ATP-binding protein
MFTAKGVSKAFGPNQVLDSLDLSVESGSIFGLVGVNGAGKSTLLRLAAGVYRCDSGSIRLYGRDTFTDPEARERISFVSDEMYFPLGSTIESMKTFYKDLYPFDEKAFAKYSDAFELHPKMRISTLSKGMKRRTAILFALSTHPRLLLLDEAYDGLEPVARLRLKRILVDLVEDEGLSVIISSHSLKELEDICDSYGILDGGRMQSYGDLLAARGDINKYQIVFDREPRREDFEGLDLLRYKAEGRVARLVVRGDRDETLKRINALMPLLVDVLPVDFEEMFIYEVSGGEDDE